MASTQPELVSSRTPSLRGPVSHYAMAAPIAQNTASREGSRAQSQQQSSEEGDGEPDVEEELSVSTSQGHSPKTAREVVRLFQCRICSLPLRQAVTLPCGKSICKKCLPKSHPRPSITYPARPTRLEGFQCPFDDCHREHAVDDCSVDVILNKAVQYMSDQMDRCKAQAPDLRLSTRILILDPWEVAGVASMRANKSCPITLDGGRMAATWALAQQGTLATETELQYCELSTPTSDGEDSAMSDEDTLEIETFTAIQEAMRSEMDCQVCYALFLEPVTTGCGHTFCRACLHRILDHSSLCPLCRRKLAINPLLQRTSCPSNAAVTKIIDSFWHDEVIARQEVLAADQAAQRQQLKVPLFVCSLAFPHMPTFLHVFEARYRHMMRCVLEGDRTFGMVLPKRQQSSTDPPFHEIGTLLRIVNIQFFADGRSLVETVGLSRFKVLRHESQDGYLVSKIERIDDVGLEEEEAMEAAEVVLGSNTTILSRAVDGMHDDGGGGDDDDDITTAIDGQPSGDNIATDVWRDIHSNLSTLDTEHMSTQDLMRLATSYVVRMRAESAHWMAERTISIYGECPDDPAIFPWWLASILPVKQLEKYRLLGTSSVRDRLKICCAWIVELEARRWSLRGGCTIF